MQDFSEGKKKPWLKCIPVSIYEVIILSVRVYLFNRGLDLFMDIHNFLCYETGDLAVLIQDSFPREEKTILVYNMAQKAQMALKMFQNFHLLSLQICIAN